MFLDLNARAKGISLFPNPFDHAVEELPPSLQLELISLQCNDVLIGNSKKKIKYDSVNAFQVINVLN